MLITIVTEASSQCALLSRVANTAVSRGLNFCMKVQFHICLRQSSSLLHLLDLSLVPLFVFLGLQACWKQGANVTEK